jgi:hypothetical protein
MLVIDIYLKNNKGNLKDGVIFKTNEKGCLPIENINDIEKYLENDFIFFQNRRINTTIAKENIENYIIKSIDEKYW